MDYSMVQVVENRADIDGRVLALSPDATRADHHVVTLDVGAATPVEGYPNLFTKAAGNRLDVLLPSELATSLRVGTMVRCRVRRAGPTTVIGDHCSPR